MEPSPPTTRFVSSSISFRTRLKSEKTRPLQWRNSAYSANVKNSFNHLIAQLDNLNCIFLVQHSSCQNSSFTKTVISSSEAGQRKEMFPPVFACISCRTKGLLVQMPAPLGKKSLKAADGLNELHAPKTHDVRSRRTLGLSLGRERFPV